MYRHWHALGCAQIHRIALAEGLETGFMTKNNLTDKELSLIFHWVLKQSYGVANLKQHYAAILIAWTTSARPGSFTVSKGYRKGAETSVPGIFPKTDQTLRWSDVEFKRLPDGTISARVSFRYHKGYRDQYRRNAVFEAKRTFTFLPTQSDRYEFDMSLILLGLAWNRGLLAYDTFDQVLRGTEVFIRKNEVCGSTR